MTAGLSAHSEPNFTGRPSVSGSTISESLALKDIHGFSVRESKLSSNMHFRMSSSQAYAACPHASIAWNSDE